ncbi:MAG TPA: metallopeptidase TldD-related protein [Candidatus Melainabacteria bacterium]|nr:metallopeptidase TldD-related protein [Candidatus Melainabacteria bacterium]
MNKALALSLVISLFCQAGAFAADKFMNTLDNELKRSFKLLQRKGTYPLYYLAYRVFEDDYVSLKGKFGALTKESDPSKFRNLQVELRVGDSHMDNSHKLRGSTNTVTHVWSDSLPIEDDDKAIANVLWRSTDKAFKAAQKQLTLVKASRALKVKEQDLSGDFTDEKPCHYLGEVREFAPTPSDWQSRLRRLSGLFNKYDRVRDSAVNYSSERQISYMVSSDGAVKREELRSNLVSVYAEAVADDGMILWFYDRFESTDADGLPSEAVLTEKIETMAKRLTDLTRAPLAEPFVGPAILSGRAAGVFFHEILGHRLEGHRQKDEEEGRTFKEKIGTRIMPVFISVVDDPSCTRLNGIELSGSYKYDDEGIASRKTVLVDKGVLKTFLMSRSPVEGIPHSNGHGRCDYVSAPCARQGNLMVIADGDKRVPSEELKEMLRREARRQGKPYGLYFDEMAGGSTFTQADQPQLYKLYPLMGTRVFTGRPDELIRGVDIVGTPLASLENILGAADDLGVFNGVCGAESGSVPVSASSPSLLIHTIEVQRKPKSDDKPALLPPPPGRRQP